MKLLFHSVAKPECTLSFTLYFRVCCKTGRLEIFLWKFRDIDICSAVPRRDQLASGFALAWR